MKPDDMTYEQFCHHMLARLREQHEKDCKPWVDRLVEIEATKPRRYLIVKTAAGIAVEGDEPNVKDDLAGANPRRQAENNHAAGSSPSTCWADMQSAGGMP